MDLFDIPPSGLDQLSGFLPDHFGKILSCYNLNTLSQLKVEVDVFEEAIEIYCSLLSPLMNLRKLKVVDRANDTNDKEQLDLQEWLIPFIESLPNLNEVIFPYYKLTFKYENELRQYLKRVYRQFSINSSEFVKC